MISKLLLIAVLSFPFLAVAAEAKPDKPACDVVVEELGEAKVNHYNALDGGNYLEEIRLRLRNRGDEACSGLVKISRISASPELDGPHGHKLSYTIVDQADFSSIVYDPVTNSGNPLAVTIPANSTIELSPRLFVPGSQPGRAGRYAATLEAAFTPAGKLKSQGSARVTVSAQVKATVQANFVGSTDPRSARLDLGELEPHKQASIGLQIRSSSDYRISFRSKNRGVLVGPASATIPYSLQYAGLAIDLSRKYEQDIQPGDPLELRTNMIRVTIGEFSDAPVGSYSDQVTIRISGL